MSVFTTAEAATSASAVADTGTTQSGNAEREVFERSFAGEASKEPTKEDLGKPKEGAKEEPKEKPKEKEPDGKADKDGKASPDKGKDGEKKSAPEPGKEEDKDSDKKEGNPAPGEPKDKEDAPKNPPHKKTARERVQESRREMRVWQTQAQAAQARIEALTQELEAIKSKKPEELTPREQMREAVIEDRLQEHSVAQVQELDAYIDQLPGFLEKEKFKVDYDDYIPQLVEKDPWTIKTVAQFPQKYEVLRAIFNAISAKQFTLKDWVEESKSVKLDAIGRILNQLENPAEPPGKPAKGKEGAKEAQTVKQMPDSVVPEDSKTTAELPEMTQEAAFRKAFQRG